jgi:hypothetical protein
MKTLLCAATIALGVGLPTFAQAETGPAASINVARIKSVLHLRPEQEAYWPAVEAAVRDVARHQGAHRITGHIVPIVLDSTAVHRIAAAAKPLISALDFSQIQAANGVASEMGLSAVVAALY